MRLQSSSTGGLAVGEADNRYLRLAGGTMTGELNALAGLNTVRPYSSGLVPAGLSDPAPAFPFETEWNNAGKNWTAVRVSVTNTASGSASKLAVFQVGGQSRAEIRKDGQISINSIYAWSDPTSILSVKDSGGVERLGINSGGLVNSQGGWFTSYGNWADFSFRAGSTSGFLLKTVGGPLVGYVGADFVLSWTAGSADSAIGDAGIGRNAAGVLEFNNGTAGTLRDWKARRGSLSEYLDITEMSAPAAPAANTARLYVEDNGSGKTRLMVLFPTGAAQVLATEP